jgi:uncharacterized membrane-anchored protein
MKTDNHIDKSIDDLLSRIEQECNEDLDTLLTVNPEHYTTEHLFQLRGRWQQRNRQYRRLSNIVFGLGASSPLFFALGMLGFWIKAILGVIFLPLAVLSFMGFLFGMFIISAKYKSSGYQEAILRAIDGELKRRGQFVE